MRGIFFGNASVAQLQQTGGRQPSCIQLLPRNANLPLSTRQKKRPTKHTRRRTMENHCPGAPEPSTTASSLHKSCASHLQQHKARCCPNLATAGCRLVQHTTWQRSSREPYQHSDTSHAWLKTTTTCTHAQNCSNTQARTHSDVFYPTALPHRQMLAR